MKTKILTLLLLMMASLPSVAEVTNVELTQKEFNLIGGGNRQNKNESHCQQ